MTFQILQTYSSTVIQLLPGCFVLIVYFVYKRVTSRKNQPPCYSGWIPWLGCALEFGKAPLLFINEARQRFGPLFTLKVAGQRMTFVTDSSDFQAYFQSPCVDFQGAVQKPTSKTASVPKKSFEAYHTTIHDMIKHRLAPARLNEFFPLLHSKFSSQTDKVWGESGKGDLHVFVRRSMYAAVLDNIMGNHVLPTASEEDFRLLEENFIRYDSEFEYGSQLPAFMIKKWSQSKSWLLGVFTDVVRKISSAPPTNDQQTILQNLLAIVDKESGANFALLLMWASLANAIPITFWSLCYILSSESATKQAKAEIGSVLGSDSKGKVELTLADMQRFPFVRRCILESIRLHSPGTIARNVSKSFRIRDYVIPEGDLLMLSPYWAHRDTNFFPDPESFKPERWEKADLERNLFLDGFVAFGGGRYQCPGRWFGLMEIHLFIVLLLHSYDIMLEAPGTVPKPSPLHVVGTQLPVSPVTVSYNRC